MKPPKITIAGQDYRLKPTPPGQNGCHLCALLLWCYDNFQNMQCVDYEKDCYFIKEESHEDNSRMLIVTIATIIVVTMAIVIAATLHHFNNEDDERNT